MPTFVAGEGPLAKVNRVFARTAGVTCFTLWFTAVHVILLWHVECGEKDGNGEEKKGERNVNVREKAFTDLCFFHGCITRDGKRVS